MLIKASLLIIAIFCSTLVQAQHSLTRGQREIQHTMINFFDALSNRDSVSLKNYSTTDIILFEYGRVWTLDTLIRRVIKLNTATDFKRVNTLEFMNSSVDKKTAWATYNLHSEITREGKQTSVHWLESVILVKEKKKWRVKVLHSTLIKRA